MTDQDKKAGRCPMCGGKLDLVAGADPDKAGLCYACLKKAWSIKPDALRKRQPAVREAVKDIERAKRVSRETLGREINV